jgi:hypothetical protein
MKIFLIGVKIKWLNNKAQILVFVQDFERTEILHKKATSTEMAFQP